DQPIPRLDIGAHVLFEPLSVGQITGADAPSADLVFVGGTDAARGGANFSFAAPCLRKKVEITVIRQEQMRPVAREKAISDINAVPGELVELREERLRIHDDAVADDADHIRMENARRNEPQHEFRAVDVHGMAGVVAALVSSHDVKPGSKEIDDFS